MTETASKKAGFTLIELVMAIAVWMIFMAGATHFIWYTARTSAEIKARQNLLENARVSVDMLTVNLQMTDDIVLTTDHDGMLRFLRVFQIDPRGNDHRYTFRYNRDLPASATRFRRLEMGNRGTYNELASYISEVRLIPSENRQLIQIIVTATDENLEESITLESAVDIRYKDFVLILY